MKLEFTNDFDIEFILELYFNGKIYTEEVPSKITRIFRKDEFKNYIDEITGLSKMSLEKLTELYAEKVLKQLEEFSLLYPEYKDNTEKKLEQYTGYMSDISRMHSKVYKEANLEKMWKNLNMFSYETTPYTLENTISDKELYENELTVEMTNSLEELGKMSRRMFYKNGGYYEEKYYQENYDIINPFTNEPLTLKDENVLYVYRFNGYTYQQGLTISPWLKKYLLEKYIPIEKIVKVGEIGLLGRLEKELLEDKENDFSKRLLKEAHEPSCIANYFEHIDINVCEYRFYVQEEHERERQSYYIGFCHKDKDVLMDTLEKMDNTTINPDRIFRKK